MPSRIELCNTSDVDVGGALRVEKDDLILAVFNVDGEFFVTCLLYTSPSPRDS